MNRLVSLFRLQNGISWYGQSNRNFLNYMKLDQLRKSLTTDEFGPKSTPRKFGKDPNHAEIKSHPPPEFLKPGEKPEEFDVICYKLHFVRINNLGYKLKLASLYNQATIGPNNEAEPAKDDHYEHAYWTAWKQLANMSKEEAKREYIRIGKQRMEERDPDIIIND